MHEEKDRLDFDARWRKLEAIVAPYRAQDAARLTTASCRSPARTTSHFIVHLVKERLGLNPLLVTYNKYFNTPLGIRNLANLRIRFDCDILVQNVNPVSVREDHARELAPVRQHLLAVPGRADACFRCRPRCAIEVPLIIWGAHQGLEQVGMFSHEHEVEMTRRYRKDHDLMGHEADDLSRSSTRCARTTSGNTAIRTMRASTRSGCAASISATTCAGTPRRSTSR